MFDRFAERARLAMVLAQEEARELKHNYVGTEHLLLGLLRQDDGLAARLLASLDVTLEKVRAEVDRIVGPGDEVTRGQIPFTPRAKRALELALKEARSLGHDHIGTEHLLLGLLRKSEGVAARILLDFDIRYETVRSEVAPAGGAEPVHGSARQVDGQRKQLTQRVAASSAFGVCGVCLGVGILLGRLIWG
jgi:ATP-dependent Clp protease ATP-binding subunit ClpC